MSTTSFYIFFFFFNDTATTEIYTLSLHDALPIWRLQERGIQVAFRLVGNLFTSLEMMGITLTLMQLDDELLDRKSTRLNSSHSQISYAVFCLKKKKRDREQEILQLYDKCNEDRHS